MNSFNQQEFSNYTVVGSQQATGTSTIAKKFMANVFAWMFIALGISTVMAVMFATNESLLQLMFTQTTKGIGLSGFGWIIQFSPLIFLCAQQAFCSAAYFVFCIVCRYYGHEP